MARRVDTDCLRYRGINSSLLTTEFLILKIGATISCFPSLEKPPILRLLLV